MNPHKLILDFSKAFDKVSHLELLCKFKSMGIVGDVHWLQAYLSNRFQCVKIHQSCSSLLPGCPRAVFWAQFYFLFTSQPLYVIPRYFILLMIPSYQSTLLLTVLFCSRILSLLLVEVSIGGFYLTKQSLTLFLFIFALSVVTPITLSMQSLSTLVVSKKTSVYF